MKCSGNAMIGHMGPIKIRLTDKTHCLPASNLEFSNHSETHSPPLNMCETTFAQHHAQGRLK